VKGVFLCAGKGTRMRPISYSVPKHLIPLANKQLLRYNVEKVLDAGISEIGLVVSPEMESAYREVLGTEKWGVSITYINQVDPKGLAHAVSCAEDFVGDQPFFVYLGDNLFETDFKRMIDEFRSGDASASITLAPVDDPTRFGVAELEGDRIVNLVEKPDDPPSNMAIVGAYAFTPEIFSAINEIEPSDRGEYEITDAIQRLIDLDHKVISTELAGWWIDVGKPEDALDANKVLMDKIVGDLGGDFDNVETENRGKIEVGPGSKVCDSELIGPVSIGEDVEISNAVIGPYVSVGDSCEINKTRIKNSVLMENSLVERTEVINSIIGADAVISIGKNKLEILAGNKVEVKELNQPDS